MFNAMDNTASYDSDQSIEGLLESDYEGSPTPPLLSLVCLYIINSLFIHFNHIAIVCLLLIYLKSCNIT